MIVFFVVICVNLYIGFLYLFDVVFIVFIDRKEGKVFFLGVDEVVDVYCGYIKGSRWFF